jgi:hypothetical protein
MTPEEIYKKLLCFGFFPEKLEGILTSKEFGKWIIKNESKINIENKKRFSVITYKLTRNNNSPRYLQIANPFGFVRLAREIKKNWEKIEKKILYSGYEDKSMIRPVEDNSNKRLISLNSYDQPKNKESILLSLQFGKKFYVHADIASCFPSIYTHSFSWALVGKNEAKKNQQQDRKWYNRIDAAVRNLQDGETKGISIGPDSSGILAELILSQIDKKLKKYDYLRFIDDYQCYCATQEEAESFITELAKALEEYRFILNTKKTKILPLPQALNEDWVRKLRRFTDWDEINKYSKNKVLGYLDLASELFVENPGESSIRFAAQTIKKKEFGDYDSFNLVFSYFLNLCFLYPYVTDICGDFIEKGLEKFPEKEDEIKEKAQTAFSKHILEHIKNTRSDALVWSIFYSIKFDLEIPNWTKLQVKILKSQDCVSTLLTYLYCKKRGINFPDITSQLDFNTWWLFIYEYYRIEGRSLRSKDSEFEKMRLKNISFLNDEILNL